MIGQNIARTREKVHEGLLQLGSLLVQLSRTLVGVLGEARAQLFHLRLAFRSQHDDDGSVLRVVEAVYCVGRHVQHTMLPLHTKQ